MSFKVNNSKRGRKKLQIHCDNCLATEFFTPLDSISKLSRRCFPPLCFTAFPNPMALFLTSASWSPAALNAKSATEKGTAPSPTPYL